MHERTCTNRTIFFYTASIKTRLFKLKNGQNKNQIFYHLICSSNRCSSLKSFGSPC